MDKLMHDMFTDQVNIVHVVVNGNGKVQNWIIRLLRLRLSFRKRVVDMLN